MSIADSTVSSELSPLAEGGQFEVGPSPGISPWGLAVRRMRRNRAALADAYEDEAAAAAYAPDAALVNFYDERAKMGMHRDKDERSDKPVVSLSIGDTCVFRFGNTQTRGRPYTDVELESGDLFVFGGPSRFAYHGVPRLRPNTADPATGMTTGRLNITLRETGMP